MRSRLPWLGAAVLVVVLAVAAFVVLRGRGADSGEGATARIQPVTAPSPLASGWNLSGGGLISGGQVITPEAAPDGTAVADGGSGRPAVDAGPGDFVGFQPAMLILPSGTRAPISGAGVRSDGTLAVPDDPAEVGWWTGGALPGERYGGVVLAGHVDSRAYGLGVLAEMLKIKKGAVITVGGDAGQQQRYRVAKVEQIDKARLAADTGAFDQNVSQRLVLITCGGPYNAQIHHYRDNVVVTADPIS